MPRQIYTTTGGNPLVYESAGGVYAPADTGGGGGASYIDSFEYTALTSNYEGDTANLALTTDATRVFDGSKALASIAGDSGYIYSLDTAAASRGTTYEFRVYFEEDAGDTNFVRALFVQQGLSLSDAGLWIEMDPSTPIIQLRARSPDGTLTVLGNDNVAVPTGEWLRVELATDTVAAGGAVNLTVENAAGSPVASASGTDTTVPDTGRYGWGVFNKTGAQQVFIDAFGEVP